MIIAISNIFKLKESLKSLKIIKRKVLYYYQLLIILKRKKFFYNILHIQNVEKIFNKNKDKEEQNIYVITFV